MVGSKGGVLVAAFAALTLLFAACGGGGGEGASESHVNRDTGSTNGVILDNRTGTPPPPPQVTNPKKAAQRASCYFFRNLEDEGHKRLPPDAPTPEYDADPPDSGPSVEHPYQLADGAYRVMPDAIDFVHSLDHGRMEIQYAPDIPEKSQLELKGLYDTMYGGTLLFPNEEMNFAVAATTWTNALRCPSFEGRTTLDAIRAFGKATWGKFGSEPVKDYPVDGPTPANPEEGNAE